MVNIHCKVDNGVTLVHIKKFSNLRLTICAHKTGMQVRYSTGRSTDILFMLYTLCPCTVSVQDLTEILVDSGLKVEK
jgi:hypothetical protein